MKIPNLKFINLPDIEFLLITITMVDEVLRDTGFRQNTSVPFIALLIGLVTSLVTKGRSCRGDILEKVNKTELTISELVSVRSLRNRLPNLTATVKHPK